MQAAPPACLPDKHMFKQEAKEAAASLDRLYQSALRRLCLVLCCVEISLGVWKHSWPCSPVVSALTPNTKLGFISERSQVGFRRHQCPPPSAMSDDLSEDGPCLQTLCVPNPRPSSLCVSPTHWNRMLSVKSDEGF